MIPASTIKAAAEAMWRLEQLEESEESATLQRDVHQKRLEEIGEERAELLAKLRDLGVTPA